jgi:flagellar protein FliT
MSERLLDYYKAIEDGSRRMLDAARADDWDEVLRFESACAVLIAQLREHSRSLNLDAAQRAEKAQIMQRILRMDAQMRELADPCLDQLDQMCMEHGPSQFLH